MTITRCLLAAATLSLVACGGGETSETETAGTSTPPPTKVATPNAPTGGKAAVLQAYTDQCLMCHGPTGRGDGSMVAGLPIKPRSFAADGWRFVDFSAGDDAVRAAIEKVLREGITDAMMPGYAATLTGEQMTGMVDYVLELRERGRGG